MKIVRVVLSFLLLATFAGVAGAEDWPTRRLRIVVPFPAGGSGDVQVRIVADELAKVLGQPVIVENKPGASGGLAAVDVAHAPPDGYTLMVGSVGTHAINVSLYSKLQYDPVKDFAPLTLMTVFPQLIVPGINFKGNTLADLIASLKADARQGELRFVRNWLADASCRRAVQDRNWRGHRSRAIPWAGAGGQRSAWRRTAGDVSLRSGHASLHRGGQAARARDYE